MSQLYTRIFNAILDSSLADNWQVRHVFQDFLMLAQDGVVDMTRHAIARRTNVPMEIINNAIEVLEAPDKASRDPENEGRRLLRIDEHRDWGWFIANWEKYDAIRRHEQRTEQAKERMRRRREKLSKESPPAPPKSITQPSSAQLMGIRNESEQSVTERNISHKPIIDSNIECVTSEIPTIEEVTTYGSMHNVGPDVCKRFWQHYQGNNTWINGFGRLINWKIKLATWRDNERSNSNGQSKRSGGAGAFAPDRNKGTANEGKAHLYAGLGRMGRVQNTTGPTT